MLTRPGLRFEYSRSKRERHDTGDYMEWLEERVLRLENERERTTDSVLRDIHANTAKPRFFPMDFFDPARTREPESTEEETLG